MKGVRFPRKLVFPLDYVVKLVWQDHAEFCEEHGAQQGVAFFEFEDEKCGGTMYLDRSRNLMELIDDMDHELGHVMVEFREHYREHFRQKVKDLVLPPTV